MSCSYHFYHMLSIVWDQSYTNLQADVKESATAVRLLMQMADKIVRFKKGCCSIPMCKLISNWFLGRTIHGLCRNENKYGKIILHIVIQGLSAKFPHW